MLNTAARLARTELIRNSLFVFGLVNFNGYLFSRDATVCRDNMYDYIIVGGGTSGNVIAGRLAAAGNSVILLEVGGTPNIDANYPGLYPLLRTSRVDWNFTYSGNNSMWFQCKKSNFNPFFAKALGGLSVTDDMLYTRGNPGNFEKWVRITNDSSWSWDKMMPYFIKSEKLDDPAILNSPFKQYHGTNGTIGVRRDLNDVCDEYIKAFEAAGEPSVLDNISNATCGYSRAFFRIYKGHRSAVNSGYLAPLKDNQNLHISRHSLVTKIIFDENNTAIGVEFVKNGEKIIIKAKKEVIICAGPVKTPQLLMLSGIGPKKDLEKIGIKVLSDLPVGKNLQTNLGVVLGFKTNRKLKPKQFNPHIAPAPIVVGYSKVNNSKYAEIETVNIIMNSLDYLVQYCGSELGIQQSICDEFQSRAEGNEMMLTLLTNLKTKSRGEVRLQNTNPYIQPLIETKYYSNKEDLDTIVKVTKSFLKIQDSPIFQSWGLKLVDPTKKCSKFEKDSMQYWECFSLCMIQTNRGYASTCVMGSVVDKNLHVYGTKNLRLVGTSIMPAPVSGSPTATLIALSEKVSDMIIKANK